MFGIGWSEYLLIGIVALIAIGPKELPGVMRTAGQWMAKIRRMSAEFQSQFQEAMREADMADLKKQVDDTVRAISKPIDPAEFMDQFDAADKAAAAKKAAADTPPAVTDPAPAVDATIAPVAPAADAGVKT